MRWRGLMVLAVLLVAASLVFAACGEEDEGTTTTDEGTPVAGGVYNFYLSANPVAIDAHSVQESEGWHVATQVFEGLVGFEMDESGSMVVVPGVAESWEPNEDASVWTFKLKQGVMFQAPVSREVKAQDVVDSWNRATSPDESDWTSYILAPVEGADDAGKWAEGAKSLTGVKALDDYTVEVTLRYPFAEFPATLGHHVAAVIPVDYLNEIGAKDYKRKPVGTGPYMVEEWKNNQYVKLVRNPDYWDPDNAGYVDAIDMKIIPESSTAWLEFQKGNIDYTDVPPGQVKVAENMPEVQSGEWTAKQWPELSTAFYGFNMNNPVVGAPAADTGLEIRKAMTMAADRENVINVVMEGVGVPATGIVPEGMPGFLPDQSPYPYDPEGAKEIIAGLGDVPTLQVWYNTDEGHQKTAEVLQAGWKAAGLDIELSNYEWGTYLDMLAKSEKGDAKSSQVFRMGWLPDYPSMDNFLYPLFHSSQSATMYTFYNSPEFDDLVIQARQTADETQRWNLYHQAEKVMLTDAPCIPLYFYRSFRVTNNRIGGFVRDPMGAIDMSKIWVKPAS